MAIRTGNSSLRMDSEPGYLIIRVLRFDDRGFAERMHKIDVFNRVIIVFHAFRCDAIVPWEFEVIVPVFYKNITALLE